MWSSKLNIVSQLLFHNKLIISCFLLGLFWNPGDFRNGILEFSWIRSVTHLYNMLITSNFLQVFYNVFLHYLKFNISCLQASPVCLQPLTNASGPSQENLFVLTSALLISVIKYWGPQSLKTLSAAVAVYIKT